MNNVHVVYVQHLTAIKNLFHKVTRGSWLEQRFHFINETFPVLFTFIILLCYTHYRTSLHLLLFAMLFSWERQQMLWQSSESFVPAEKDESNVSINLSALVSLALLFVVPPGQMSRSEHKHFLQVMSRLNRFEIFPNEGLSEVIILKHLKNREESFELKENPFATLSSNLKCRGKRIEITSYEEQKTERYLKEVVRFQVCNVNIMALRIERVVSSTESVVSCHDGRNDCGIHRRKLCLFFKVSRVCDEYYNGNILS